MLKHYFVYFEIKIKFYQKMKNKIKKYLIFKINKFIIDKLTVEAGRNKRKFIWKTKNFREVTQLHIPRLIFLSFVIYMCWSINEKIKNIKKEKHSSYTSISHREEKALKDKREIDSYFNIPNEFDPNEVNEEIKLEVNEK